MPESSVAHEIAALFGLSSKPCDGADLRKVEQLAAAIDSANYLNSNMAGCDCYNSSFELLAAGLQKRSIETGLNLEFGVFNGNSINYIASQCSGQIYGFDSFEGLPEDWRPDFKKGSFTVKTPPKVPDNVTLVVGWFDSTLPKFLESNGGDIAFMHIDCDLYSSTKTIFRNLGARIVSGTVIVFDEYFNYVGWRNHEFKAFHEFLASNNLRYRYFGAVPSHQQVGIIIL